MTSLTEKILKPKLGLLELAKHLGNVSQACKTMGYSRDTFYRYKELYESGGEAALIEISRKKPIVKNRVAPHIEEAVLQIAVDNPALGQHRVSNQLKQQGILISGGGVRSIWQRHGLETFKKRLKALEAHSAKSGILLTEEQLVCLEKAKIQREARGEIETEHPGYLIAQDTYFVGTMKGVGRIYQQTVIDTYSRCAFATLYTEKTAITAAHMLNDTVIPWFSDHQVPILRVLTDRGTEYCGKLEQHAYQLYLAVENIDHTRTKAYSPQTNGIVERFHKTMKHEFYDITFRKKIYTSIEQLQIDVNQWLVTYNTMRPHSGKYCYGKTPQQTFEQGQEIVRDKHIQSWHDQTAQRQNEPDNIELDSKEDRSSIVGSAPREDMNTSLNYHGAYISECVKGDELSDKFM